MTPLAMFRHNVLILTPHGGTEDSWGHAPVEPWVEGETVRGLIQERQGREVMGPDLGGTVVVNAVAYLPIDAPVTTRDRLRRKDTGAEYDVLYVRDAAGWGSHLEVDCRRVEP